MKVSDLSKRPGLPFSAISCISHVPSSASLPHRYSSKHPILPQHLPNSSRVKRRIFRNLIHHISQIRKQVPLVPIRQDGRHACVIEFYLVVADFDEVDGRVGGHEGRECSFDDLADGALFVWEIWLACLP